jgi:hypothetical protein
MVDLNVLKARHGLVTVSKSDVYWEDLQDENRPKCSVPGCDRHAALQNTRDGVKIWRRSFWITEKHPDADGSWCCAFHHNNNTAEKHGVKSSSHLTAQRYGLTVTAYRHRNHPYLQHRKDYCENIDGRLGFTCTFTHPTPQQLEATGLDATYLGWLQVDHKDGNHTNNDPSNLQTLCACCHNIKTYQNGDHATPGRKTRVVDTGE